MDLIPSGIKIITDIKNYLKIYSKDENDECNSQKDSVKIRHFDGTCSATPSAVRVGGLVSPQLMPISLSWIMYNGHMCHPHVPEAKRTASKSMKITITFKTSVCCLHHRPETAAATCFGSRTERGARLAAPH